MSNDVPPDDLWISRLQHRADEVTPEILANPGAALQSGRRRRAARRAGIVGSAVALGLAAALGAQPALQLLRDDAMHRSTPADDPTTVVAQPSPAQIEERTRSLALMAERNAITNPPDVAVVRWVERSEHPYVIADCLTEAGFPVENVNADGYELSLHTDQESALTLADYICTAKFPALIPLPPD